MVTAVAVLATAVAGCNNDVETVGELKAQAELAIQRDDPAAAVRYLTAALAKAPEQVSLRWQLAQIYFDVGAFDFARSHLEQALAGGMSPGSVMPMLARVMSAEQDYLALTKLGIPPDTPADATAEATVEIALAYAQLRRFDRARAVMREASAIAPKIEAVQFGRARLLMLEGSRAKAESLLREALVRFPQSADLVGALADVVRDQGRLVEAEALYTEALRYTAHGLHLHFLRGEVRIDLGRSEAAAADVRKVLERAPSSFAAAYLRGRLLLLQGQPTEALTAFEAANVLEPQDIGTLLYGGAAAYAIGRIELAEDWLTRVIKEHPANARARLLLGAIRFAQQRYSEAERLLRPVPRALPGGTVSKRLLAASLMAQDKADEAVPLLSELVVEQPEDPRSQLDLSVALVLSGAKERGISALDGLVSRHPDYRPAYEYLIAYHVREQQWAEAERMADLFVEQYPEDVRARFLLGEVLLESGRRAEALNVYAEILEMEPANPAANARAAGIALAAGDREKANEHFSRVLQKHPENLNALLGQAAMAAASGRFDEAGVPLRAAIAAHPEALAPRMALARQLYGLGQPQNAAEVLQENAHPAFLGEAGYLELLTKSLLSANAPQQAADVARDLVALQPDSLAAYGLYARVLGVLDDKIALEETLRQMLTIDPGHVPTRLELVRLHIATERFGVAERLLSPLLADLNRPALADLLYGLILTATDRAAQAVAPLRHAHAALSSQRTLLALANAEAQAGSLDEAIERQSAWLAGHPDDVEVRVNLAGHLVQAERVSDALVAYERALQTSPNHLVALNNLAWYSLEADPERAVALAQRAHEQRPESLETAHTLVNAQVEAGQWRDAELTLDRALARDPTDPGLLWLSARVLHQKGRAEGALRRLERLLENEIPRDERRRAEVLLTRIQDELGIEDADW